MFITIILQQYYRYNTAILPLYYSQTHVHPFPHTDTRYVDLYAKNELGRNNEKNEAYGLEGVNLEHYIQNFISQTYPEALGYTKEVTKAVTKMLRQVMY